MAVVSRLLLATNRKLFHTNELVGKLLWKNNNYALQNQGDEDNYISFSR